MKPREGRSAVLAAPPEALLWFTDPSGSVNGGPGMAAYVDRAVWLAARRDWEARHGMTIAAWSEATHAELARRAGSLPELNEALVLTMYEPDDDNWDDNWDPRLDEANAAGRA